MNLRILGAALALAVATNAVADVKPHALFSDGMVLQQGMKVNVWGQADDGEMILVRYRGQEALTTARGGNWKVQLGPFQPGPSDTLTIHGRNTIEIKDVVVGEVWVASGQSNMEWPVVASENGAEEAKLANLPDVRLFTVPKNVQAKPIGAVRSNWLPCTPKSVLGFSAVGYYFGRKLQWELNVPVGIIHTSWGGTPAEAWTSREALAANPRLKAELLDPFDHAVANPPPPPKEEPGKKRRNQPGVNQNSPTTLYNGMIAPIKNYAIRGAIWYQGESNASRADQYRVLFPAMIECWRKEWNQGNFPFYFVQLAPFKSGVAWAELRESQRETAHKLQNAAQAVITDIDVGDPRDIHPKKKREVGERLAAIALVDVYNRKGEGRGPDVKGQRVEGSSIVLEFDHVGRGLVVHGDKLRGFTIAAEDQKFVPAEAKLAANKVAVSSSGVAKPVAVRYDWTDVPDGNLFNADGFPTTPFRTDSFAFVTAPKAPAPSPSANPPKAAAKPVGAEK